MTDNEAPHTHLQELMDEKDRRYQDKFFTLERMLKSLIEANDERYQARFVAQEKAVDAALTSSEKALKAALTSSEKAINVAEVATTAWKANANEWRSTLSDRDAQFASQAELLSIKERIDRTEGSGSGKKEIWTLIGAGVLLFISVINFWNGRILSSAPPEQSTQSGIELGNLQKSVDLNTQMIEEVQKEIQIFMKDKK